MKDIVKELFDEQILKLTTEMKRKKKRSPSKYNIFIGKCMKEEGKTMKVCSAEYKAKKAS